MLLCEALRSMSLLLFALYYCFCSAENFSRQFVRGDIEPVNVFEGFKPGPLVLGKTPRVFLY
jgi:hypothetical protein